jgi:hypothetical protein
MEVDRHMEFVTLDQNRLIAIFGNGAAKSAGELAAASGAPWNISIVSLELQTGASFLSTLPGSETEYSGVRLSSPDESYLVLFSEESGRALLNAPFLSRGRGAAELPEEELAGFAKVVVDGLSGHLSELQGMGGFVPEPVPGRGGKAEVCALAFGPRFVDEPFVDVLILVASPQAAAECTILFRLDTLSANFRMRQSRNALPLFSRAR